jgi:hypothetical protein
MALHTGDVEQSSSSGNSGGSSHSGTGDGSYQGLVLHP